MSDIRFDGKVAVITGAGAGLGRIHALELARRGAMIVVNDLGSALDGSGQTQKAADSVVEEIIKDGGKAVSNYDSVSTVQGGENITACALDTFGSLDILVNNAGIVRDHSFTKMTEDEWDAVLTVHLKGAYCVTRPALAAMKERNYGRIIFTSSGVGLYGNFGQANYASAKMGLIGLMNVLKLETAKNNIRINTIAPNAVTRMTSSIFPPNLAELLKPEYITPLLLYLASEENNDNGMIFNCFSGYYSRTAIVCSKGVLLGDGKTNISPEEIRSHWNEITALEEPKTLGSIVESFGYIAPLLNK
ncbi:MAG: serine/threonine protein kinase [Spirochaetae bacterium HGW-Spirochaetae-1]|jgi:NAD(P)-dependent dehydrogenase (short-subunit alcohol dehydrogenase family)|nr:MAG: serine/threonine protein kinase [Spirochaetae bacterium HGW-Spirochaetae-1]